MNQRVRNTDHALLGRLGGSDGDWETFVATYYSKVEKIATARVRNRDEAQDIAQDVMMKLVRRLRKGWKDEKGRAGFEALLNVIINHCVASYFSLKNRQLRGGGELPPDTQLEMRLQQFSGGSETPDGDAVELAGELPEDRRLLQQALGDLPETDRLVLTHDGKGAELAEQLNKKAGAVRAQRFRAMKRLKKALRQRMVRWQTEFRPSIADGFALEHLTWAGQMILDQHRGTGSGPALLFRRKASERKVESIRLGSRTDIGRDTFADLDPTVFDPQVSLPHCRIESPDDGLWLIEDVGSTNGTRVNGRRLAVEDPVELRDGDRLEIGRQLLVFSTGESAPEEAS